eukprot:scaffold4998_cov120-Isochrysis_galbana.AAC.10
MQEGGSSEGAFVETREVLSSEVTEQHRAAIVAVDNKLGSSAPPAKGEKGGFLPGLVRSLNGGLNGGPDAPRQSGEPCVDVLSRAPAVPAHLRHRLSHSSLACTPQYRSFRWGLRPLTDDGSSRHSNGGRDGD